MAKTDNLRLQHATMAEIVNRISTQLKADVVAANAEDIRKNISTLAGKLSVHLAMEDQVLYPKLLKHENPNVAAVARRYIAELGGIKEAFQQYNQKWLTPASIQAKPQEFIEDTASLFRLLNKRIEQENNELYELVDSL